MVEPLSFPIAAVPMHIDVVHHDGSGTIITSIEFTECKGTLFCKRCTEYDRPVSVRINA